MARRDRLVLKRYEAEIDLSCSIAVDGSGSMAYQGGRASVDKFRYASLLAASLAYLVLHQQDRVGLLIFNDTGVIEEAPGRQGMLDRFCNHLQQYSPSGLTDSGEALARLAQGNLRRGLVIIVSDGLEDPDQIVAAFDRLRHRGHDVALIWLLDPDECDLGLGALSRFQGLEGDGEIVAEPKALRQAYQVIVEQHRLRLEEACRSRRVVFVPARTDEAPHLPLNNLLVGLQHG